MKRRAGATPDQQTVIDLAAGILKEWLDAQKDQRLAVAPIAVACAVNPLCVAVESAMATAVTITADLIAGAILIWAVDNANNGGDYTDKVGKVARDASKELGRTVTEKEIRDAIHGVKDNLGRGGPIRNPDVVIDPRTGDVRPKTPHGPGDSIGNIYDYLR